MSEASTFDRVRQLAEALAGHALDASVEEDAIRAGMAALQADAGSLALLEKGTETLHPRVSVGFPQTAVARYRTFSLKDPLPVPDSIRDGAPILIPDEAAFLRRWPHLGAAIARPPPFQAYAVTPLRVGDQTVGGLLFAWREPRVFGREDEGLVATLGALVGAALHRAELHDAEARASRDAESRARREARLQRLTALLAQAVTVDEVLAAVVDSGVGLLGARAGSLAFVNEEDGVVSVQRSVGYAAELMARLARTPLPDRVPLSDVARSGEAIFLSDALARATRYPHLANALASNGPGAMCALPLAAGGRVIGAIGLNFSEAMAFDAEERAFLLAFAQQSAQALARARLLASEREARLQAARNKTLSALGQLVSGVAHELRTPLAAIQNNASLVRLRLERAARADAAVAGVTGEVEPFLAGVQDGIDRINALVGQLRHLTRPASSSLVPRPLDALSRDAVSVFLIAHPGATIETDLRPTAHVRVDAFDLQQVLFNLLQNALDATPPGGAPVRVSTRDADGGTVELVVEDAGAGIPPDVQARLFEPLFTTKADGTGLGLSIARRIVTSQGGDISFTTAAGRGTRFVVRLPGA